MSPLGYIKHSKGIDGAEGDKKYQVAYTRYSFLCQNCCFFAAKLLEGLIALVFGLQARNTSSIFYKNKSADCRASNLVHLLQLLNLLDYFQRHRAFFFPLHSFNVEEATEALCPQQAKLVGF